jgi:hypothetical protein
MINSVNDFFSKGRLLQWFYFAGQSDFMKKPKDIGNVGWWYWSTGVVSAVELCTSSRNLTSQ